MDYYVNGETGSDSNSGLSWAEAFATINHAISIASRQRNDIVYISGDMADFSQQTYDEKIELSAGNLGCILDVDTNNYEYELYGYFIKLIGVGENKPVINPTVPVNDGRANLLQNYYNGIWFENIEFSNESSLSTYVFEVNSSRFAVFKNCVFNSHNGYIVHIWNYAGRIMIDSCVFKTNGISTRILRFYIGRGRPVYIQNCTVENEGIYCDIEIASFEEITFFNNEILNSNCVISGADTGTWIAEVNVPSQFQSYVSSLAFKDTIFRDKLTLGTHNTDKYIENMKNVTYLADEIDISADWIFENCVLWGDTDLTINRLDWGRTGKLIFKNCILRHDPEVLFPTDIIEVENCLIGVDPLLDENGVPTSDSPCLPENWTGAEPIDTFIGWKPYYLEPSLSSLSINGTKGDIEISVTYEGYNDLDFILEYSLDDGITWNTATIDYNDVKELKGDSTGIINKLLWKSKLDFLTDENSVKIKISGNDTINDSNILTSSSFSVYNQPILLVEPSISDLQINGTKEEIEVSMNVFDEYSIVQGELQYLNGTNWYTCTLKYSNGNYFTANELGEENNVLWDSEDDFTINLNTKIRARVMDSDGQTSDWVESLSFNVNNLYIPPVIDNLSLSSNTQDIKIRYEAQDDEYSILNTEIQYKDGEDWYSCTIDYNPTLTSKSSLTGELNVLLWKSYDDIQSDLETKLRIRVFDTKWSDWIDTSEFTLLNGNIPPEVYWYSPLKFRIDEEEKIYFKLQKE